MSRCKYNVTPTNIREFIPDNTRLIVRHFHPGNSRPSDRRIKGGRVSPYVTQAIVVSRDETLGTRGRRILSEGSAVCAPHDHPNRKLAYRIAAGRAVRALNGRGKKRR